MSGHSKWSKVKHQKNVTDASKSQAFTRASHAISIAVKEGGGVDPDKNFRLRLALEHARSVNMPKETIDRALDKSARSDTSQLQERIYEGYGPGGIAYIITAHTDNQQRTGAMIKHALEHAGGSLGSPGSGQYLFHTNEHGELIPLFTVSVSDDVVQKNKDLIQLLTSFDDVLSIATTMGECSQTL